MPASAGSKVRFGPFEVDLSTGELSNNGNRVRLQPQPLQVLAILLERPGELITREEFRKRLWADDTFVDFEHSLNTDIKKIRHVLGDEAETPEFIETLPKRGYRFIAEVMADETAPTNRSSHTKVAPAEWRRPYKRAIASGVSLIFFVALASFAYPLLFPKTPRIIDAPRLTNTQRQKSPERLCYPATDGARVYFQEHRSGDRWALSQVSTQGGETSDIPIPPWRGTLVCLTGISPSLSELLIYACCPTKTSRVSLPTGSTRPAAVPLWGTDATWLPDGKGFAYILPTENGLQLTVGSGDGTSRKSLITSQHMLPFTRVSPDGKKIRWTVWAGREGAPSDIWEVNIDGSNPHPVFPEMKGETLMGDWTKNGELFFFFHRPRRADATSVIGEDLSLQLWVVREKLGPIALRRTPTLLYPGPLGIRSATSSLDSRELYAIGTEHRGELAIYDAEKSKFVPYLNGLQASFVTFSPDRQWITYVSYPDNTLWRSRIDGSERLQLTSPPMGVLRPSWSPDGKLILFEDAFGGIYHSIHFVPADGGQPSLLVGEQDSSDPSWSSDGKSIAYSGWFRKKLEILDIGSMKSTPVPESEHLAHPVWSPDGKWLVAHGETRLAIFSFANQKWRDLANIKVDLEAWSHDSRYVYAYAVEEGRIIRVSIHTGKVETITDLSEVSWTGGSGTFRNGWFGMTPDDKVMVLRDTGSEEVYKLVLDY